MFKVRPQDHVVLESCHGCFQNTIRMGENADAPSAREVNQCFCPCILRLETTRTTYKTTLREVRGLTRPRIYACKNLDISFWIGPWAGRVSPRAKTSCFKQVVSFQQKARRWITRMRPRSSYECGVSKDYHEKTIMSSKWSRNCIPSERVSRLVSLLSTGLVSRLVSHITTNPPPWCLLAILFDVINICVIINRLKVIGH